MRRLFRFFFSSRRRHTRSYGDWSSDVCSSDLISSLPARIYPSGNLIPRQWVVLEHTGDLEKRDPAATKYIRDFRHGTSLAISQPFAGHSGAVTDRKSVV